ncbi:MAG: hypothetical protein ACOX6T_25105 [Myxococcales bacterium]
MSGLRFPRAFAAILALSLLGLACGDDDPKTEEPKQRTCRRDSALIAEAHDCRLDEHCPCGTHCELGRCTATCSTDADCAVGGCDLFGRCRERAAESRIAPLKPAGRVGIELPSPLTRVGAASGERDVRFRLDAKGPETVRVEVDPGMEVASAEIGRGIAAGELSARHG